MSARGTQESSIADGHLEVLRCGCFAAVRCDKDTLGDMTLRVSRDHHTSRGEGGSFVAQTTTTKQQNGDVTLRTPRSERDAFNSLSPPLYSIRATV